ncbi:mechanosensitive ion channel family protein [Marisediminicola senii]|uniref:mechanosensitive ion channel family protein n=1 Tax=Marisediminicola senii TaxID=2711233 RepID=UPI0013EBAD52|nr:mechanosensitive ion channel domain-containing protein [Marisediminicola senii]
MWLTGFAGVTVAPTEVVDPAPGVDWTSFWSTVGASEGFRIALNVLIIIVGAILIRIVLHFVIRRVVNRVVSGVKKRQNVDDTQAIMASPLAAARVVQRTRTLGSVLNNVVSVVVVIVALLLIVTAIDTNIIGSFALITAALGAGLGFGAQNIVKDVLNGLFMVAEDQLGVGDVVDLGEANGVVEEVGIRITQVRDVNGTLWFVRNGEILRVGNKSQGWARVIIDLPAPYDSDVDAVQATMLNTATTMASSTQWRRKIIEAPEIWGLESMSAEALTIRLVMKTRPADQWDVARELRRQLKQALDDSGVNLPALNRVVFDGQASSPAHPAVSEERAPTAPVQVTQATAHPRANPAVRFETKKNNDSAGDR